MREAFLEIEGEDLQVSATRFERCLELLEAQDAYTVPPGSLNVLLVSAATSSALHARFFNDPEPTDVMTFPGDPEDDHAGDIAICAEVAHAAAAEYGTSLDAELTLYLVHGWLHLAGLDDREPAEVAEMRAAETTLMQYLKENGGLIEVTRRA